MILFKSASFEIRDLGSQQSASFYVEARGMALKRQSDPFRKTNNKLYCKYHCKHCKLSVSLNISKSWFIYSCYHILVSTLYRQIH